MRPLVLVASVVALSAAGCQWPEADAPTLAGHIEHTFTALDADRNGFISPSEAKASPRLARLFSRADANNDGVLNRFEFNSPGWRPFSDEPD